MTDTLIIAKSDKYTKSYREKNNIAIEILQKRTNS